MVMRVVFTYSSCISAYLLTSSLVLLDVPQTLPFQLWRHVHFWLAGFLSLSSNSSPASRHFYDSGFLAGFWVRPFCRGVGDCNFRTRGEQVLSTSKSESEDTKWMDDLRSGIFGVDWDSDSPWALTERGEERSPGSSEGESVRRAANSALYFSLIFVLFWLCDVLVYNPPQLQLLCRSFFNLRHCY